MLLNDGVKSFSRRHAKNQLRKIKSEALRWIYPDRFPLGGILVLHRIENVDPDRLWCNESLKISPSSLDKLISTLQKQGYKFVSLDEMAEIIMKKMRVRKVLSITLDDGYRDNYDNGLPIFKRYGIPFCINVVTSFPEKSMVYWWYLIENLIMQHDTIELPQGNRISCTKKKEKEEAFFAIKQEILKLPQTALDKHIAQLLPDYDIDFSAYNDTLPLTWEMLRQLRDEPLATIGCHTHSHSSFASCSDQEIIADIEYSCHLMRTKAGVDMNHFAFPYGGKTTVLSHHFSLIENMGFRTATTTRNALLFHSTHLHQLPRISITERNVNSIIDRLNNEC